MRSFVASVLMCILSVSPAIAGEPVHVWSRQYGAANFQSPSAMAFETAGNIVVVGSFQTSIDFGGGPLLSSPNAFSQNTFIAKLTPSGQQIWSKSFAGPAWPTGVAVNAAGDIVVTGSYEGTVDFGGGPLPAVAVSNPNVFVVKFDADGTHLWSAGYGSDGVQGGVGVAFDGDGNVLLSGFTHTGSVDLGGGPLNTTLSDGWVAKLDGGGSHLWSRRIGDVSSSDSLVQETSQIVADPWNNVYAVGTFSGTIDLGNGAVSAEELTSGGDMFLVKYDPSGAHLWSHIFTAGFLGTVNGESVKTDSAGNVVIAGSYTSVTDSLDFGGGLMPAGQEEHAFVASFDPLGGYRWSRALENSSLGSSGQANVGVSPSGEVSLTGSHRGTVSIEGDTLTTGDYAIGSFIARFDATGAYKWSKAFSLFTDFSEANGISTLIDDDGHVFMTGRFKGDDNSNLGSIDFGGGPFTSLGFFDMFLAEFQDPTLNPVLITRFDAHTSSGGVLVRWGLWSDETLRGFTLYRAENDGRPTILTDIEDIHAREFIDRSARAGKSYQYQLVVHGDGSEFRSPSVRVNVPELALGLGQNRPNPFNPETVIPYTVPGAEPIHTQLRVFDVAGRLVRTLVNGPQTGGAHKVRWNGLDDGANPVSSGVYFCVLEAGKSRVKSKMVLLK